jgi:hypothetical protein
MNSSKSLRKPRRKRRLPRPKKIPKRVRVESSKDSKKVVVPSKLRKHRRL